MTTTTTAPAALSPPPVSWRQRIVRACDLLGIPASRNARRELAYVVLNLVPALLGLLTLPLLAIAAGLGGISPIFAGPRRLARRLAARPHHPSTSSTRAIRAHADAPHQTPRPDPQRSGRHPLAPTFAGLRPVAAVLAAARPLAGAHRFLLNNLLGEDIPAPARTRNRQHSAPRTASDPDDWRALAHAVLDAPLSAVSAVVQILMRLYAFAGGVLYFLWYRNLRQPDGHRGLVLPGSDTPLDTWPRALAVSAAGLLLLAFTGWTGRLLCRLSRRMGSALLGPQRLAGRVRELEETRALAVRDAAAALRRIERDLHDGAQARLIAVAMSLTRAHSDLDPTRRTDTTTDRAHELVGQALAGTRTAIEELRDLVRGIHPPVLDDGLNAALASLANDIETAGTPVRLSTHAPDDRRLPEAVATIAYFCAAELLTNAARHAAASLVDVSTELHDDTLVLTVRDNGRGGVSPAASGHHGSGLAGLAERVRTIDGTVDLHSPPGGPTTAVVRLPAATATEEPACAS